MMDGTKTAITMYDNDDTYLTDDQKKWSAWTMKSKKQPRKLTDYAAAVVLLTSVVHALPSMGI